MPISMYQASAPRFVNTLTNLSAILDKAQAHAEAKKIDPAALIDFRLYPDMLPMKRQVQIACDTAKGAVARLAGVEVPKHEDKEETFAELKARIAQIVSIVEKNIHLKLGPREVDYRGMHYLLGHSIPNFYFHVTTAYEIMCHN